MLATMVVPAVRAAGPNGAAVMRALMQDRKLPVVLLVLGWTTIITGGVLSWRDAGALGFRWFEQGAGLVFGIGAVAAILGAIVGGAVNGPRAKRLAAIVAQAQAAGRPPNAEEQQEMGRLQQTIFRGTQSIALLLVIATACMAMARNIG